MARQRKWKSETERKAAYRARKAAEAAKDNLVRPTPQSQGVQISPQGAPAPPHEVESLTEAEEQAIRDYWGYSASEKRTKAERDAVAERILAKCAGDSARAAAIGAYQHAAKEKRRIAKLRSYLQTKVKPADVEPTLATMEQAREERIDGYALWEESEAEFRRAYDARQRALASRSSEKELRPPARPPA